MPRGVYIRTKPGWNKGLKYKCPAISIANKGKTAWNKGLKGLRLGHVVTSETREKISKKNIGLKKSEEARNKMSLAKLQLFSNKTNHPRWKGGITEDITKYRKILKDRHGEEGRILRNEKYVVYNRKRRVLKNKCGGFHTNEEWQELKRQYEFTCPSCLRKEPEIKLTEDHIIPIKKNGSDDISNIQPLCKNCNSKKRTKIIIYDKPTTIQIPSNF